MYQTIAFFDAPMIGPKIVPAGRMLGVGGNEIDRIGETLLEVAKKMEGLGVSGKG